MSACFWYEWQLDVPVRANLSNLLRVILNKRKRVWSQLSLQMVVKFPFLAILNFHQHIGQSCTGFGWMDFVE